MSFIDFFKKDNKKGKVEEYANEIPLGVADSADSSEVITVDSDNYNPQVQERSIVMSFSESFDREDDLIKKYEEMALDPYVCKAIADIVDEFIVYDKENNANRLSLDKIANSDMSETIKTQIIEEYDYILNLLNFNQDGYDMVKDWYIKGKKYFYPVINKKKNSIAKIVELSQNNVSKKTLIKYKNKIGELGERIKVIDERERFYIYKLNKTSNRADDFGDTFDSELEAYKFSNQSIYQIDSGIYDSRMGLILSNLHYAIKTYNMLVQSEDAMVIYRMVRAPEKRVFYIDVAGMSNTLSEKYLNNFIARFKTKQTYNHSTGKLDSGSKGIQSIYEDYFMPRKGNQTAEIDTLDAAQNLGEITDIEYLLKKLYNALKIPSTRNDPEATFTIGRATEIERDEFQFSKYIGRLRNRFSKLFIDLLRLQLSLKGIMSTEDFDKFRNDIYVEWNDDSFFREIKEQEILATRLELISSIESLEGTYFTNKYIHKNILMRSDQDYDKFEEEIAKENEGINKDDDEE